MMIRINLLPQDMRRRAATPLPVLLPALGCLTLVVVAGFAWAWLHFAELNAAEEALADLDTLVKSKAPMVAYAAGLKEEEADFETRKTTIREIAASRMLWTKKLDELFDIATQDAEGENYLVWLENLEVKAPRATQRGQQAGETVALKGYCFADKNPLQQFNLFHQALRTSPFFADFMAIDDPSGSSEDFDDGLSPRSAWLMDRNMTMKPREPEKGAKGAGTARVAQAPPAKK